MNPAHKAARLRAETSDVGMSTSRKILLFVPLILVALWGASVLYHSSRIVPKDVVTMEDFYRRYGTPHFATTFTITANTYYRIIGEITAPLAFPSGPPHYIFDFQGRLQDWTPEFPKDAEFQARWNPPSENRLGAADLAARFPPR